MQILSTVSDSAVTVRFATRADEECLVEMIRQMHEDGEWGSWDAEGRPFPFAPEKARCLVQSATQSGRNEPDAGQTWLGVIGTPGNLVGSACVTVQEPSMSEGFFLGERWNWLCPEARSDPAASDALLAFSVGIADATGMRLVMAAMTQKRAAKSRFYERRFGAPIGNVYDYSPVGAAA